MTIETMTASVVDAPILALLEAERAKALSAREWKFRLAGYGYAIRDEGDAQVVTCLTQGVDLGVLPSHLT